MKICIAIRIQHSKLKVRIVLLEATTPKPKPTTTSKPKPTTPKTTVQPTSEKPAGNSIKKSYFCITFYTILIMLPIFLILCFHYL